MAFRKYDRVTFKLCSDPACKCGAQRVQSGEKGVVERVSRRLVNVAFDGSDLAPLVRRIAFIKPAEAHLERLYIRPPKPRKEAAAIA